MQLVQLQGSKVYVKLAGVEERDTKATLITQALEKAKAKMFKN